MKNLSFLSAEDVEKQAQTKANQTGESELIWEYVNGAGFGHSSTLPTYAEAIRRVYPNV